MKNERLPEWLKKLKSFQFKTLRTKIVMLMLLCVLLSSALIGTICITETSSVLRATAEDNMVLICDRGLDAVDLKLEKIEEQVNTMRHYAETALKNPAFLQDATERAAFLTAFETVGQNHAMSADGIIGVFAIFDCGALNLTAATPTYGFNYELGGNGGLEKLDAIDFRSSLKIPDWYKKPHDRKTAQWLEVAPHAAGTHQMSYVAPILLPNGVCVGVVGVSCDTDMLVQATKNFDEYESGFAFILNADETLLYHPNIKQNSRFEDRPKFYIVEGNEKAEETGVALYTYRFNGDSRYLSYSSLRNGKKLCVSASQSEVYDRRSTLILTILLVTAGASVLALAAATLFSKQLMKPISRLNAAARAMIEGNLDTELVPTTIDEIGDLTRILNRARERIKFQISDLYNEAHHDGLTGVPNKTAFRDTERTIDRQIAYGNASFVLAVLDVNSLKITNDFYGHAAGDELLRAIAGHLKASFGPQSIYRIGGDEFALLLPGTNTAESYGIIERCVARIPDIHLPSFPDVQVSCAVGIAVFDKLIDNRFNDTLLRADRLMYRNKGDSKRKAAAIEGVKSIKQLQTDKFFEFLSILSQSTEDYLFLYEIETDKAHFFGKILERYWIPCQEDKSVSVDNMLDAIHPADRTAFHDDIRAIINGQKTEHNLNYRITSVDGATAWINCRGRVITSEDGQPFLLIGRISDTALRPFYNPITGLFNRLSYTQDMQSPNPMPTKAYMLLDIDNMSNLNIRLGRDGGDAALRLLAEKLEAVIPHYKIYHMEKDRFVVLLDTKDTDEIKQHFANLRASLDDEMSVSAAAVIHHKLTYTDENGIYEYSCQLLKESKSKKPGMLYFYTREDYLKKISNLDLFEELQHSVSNNFEGFYVVYQPQIAANGYTLAGAEALLRYRSKAHGVVSPAEFVPILERSRLINKVGLFVCETALKQCKLWREKNPDFRMAVNFSSIQLLEDETDEHVLNLLSSLELPGDALTIELTESIQLESVEVAEAFERFRAEGIHIAIDDFGTGYANLAYLKKIHADEIKIDRVFIKDINESSYNYTVICNILDFAKQNCFNVCLEGIETPEELAILDELGADTLQGFLFDKPIEPDVFEKRYLESGVPQWGFVRNLAQYRDQAQLNHMDTRYILSNVNVGLWIIRIDEERQTYKLFADPCMRNLLGIEGDLTPEECYAHWYSRIVPGHEESVNAMVRSMREGDNIRQTLYLWNHPTQGEILVRCTGKCVSHENGITVYEGFHRNVSDAGDTFTLLEDKA